MMMKKEVLTAWAAAAALLMLSGCSGKPSGGAPDAGMVTDEAPSAGKTVSPLPSGIDLTQLTDCTLAVSFEKGDAYVDDTGAMQLKVTVYDYDTYDMVDMSLLEVGDRIVICQEEVEVTALERSEEGAILLNGGLENGGYDLISGDGGVFYADAFNDAKLYYALGEATIPVSEDFEFEDASDFENGPRTYYPGDFLTEDAGIEYGFTPNNTTVTVQGGMVIQMQRIFIP